MKKVIMILGVILVSLMNLTSCGNSGYDLSSPESTINTFIKASSEKDKNGLSLCFSKQSAGEFKSVVDKTLSEKDLNDFKEMFENATIKSSKIDGSYASISVKLPQRDEEILMIKENENWVILDF